MQPKYLYFILGFVLGAILFSSFTAQAATCAGVFVGGTGICYPNQPFAHTVLLGEGSSAIATTSPSNAGYVLTSNGVNADPTFQVSTGGSSKDFNYLSNFGTTTAATTTPIWAEAGIFASSTTAYPTLAINQAGSGFAIDARAGATQIMTLNNQGALTTYNQFVAYVNGAGNQYFFAQQDGAGGVNFGAYNSNFVSFQIDGSPLNLNSRALNTVNVGAIGTLSNLNVFGTASTSALTISNLTGTQCLQEIAGVVSGTGSGCGSGGSSFSYPFPGTGNSTTSPIMLLASTTIGAGGAQGLTINGNATTTGIAYFGGNVGIGTNDPIIPLDIIGNIAAGSVTERIQNIAGVGSGVQIQLGSNTVTNTFSAGANILMRRTDAVTSGDSDLIFQNSAGTTMVSNLVIKSNGNIGVSSTSPYAILSVGTLGGVSLAPSTLFAIGSSTAAYATSTLFSVLSTGAVNIAPVTGYTTIGNCAATGSRFLTVCGASNNGVMALLSPAAGAETSLDFDDSSHHWLFGENIGGNTSGQFSIYSGTTGHNGIQINLNDNVILNQTAGNTGIGTTSPSQTLSVQGNQYTSGTAFFGGAITATSTLTLPTLGTPAGAYLAVNPQGQVIATTTPSGGGSGTVGAGTTGQDAYYAASGTTLTATSTIFLGTNSRVGINTTSPAYQFDVAGTIQGQNVYAKGANAIEQLTNTNDSASPEIQLQATYSSGQIQDPQNTTVFYLGQAYQGGNGILGSAETIAVTDPSQLQNIFDDGTGNAFFKGNVGVGYTPNTSMPSLASGAAFQVFGTSNSLFGGKVGIGTTTPTTALVSVAASTTAGTVQTAYNGVAAIIGGLENAVFKAFLVIDQWGHIIYSGDTPSVSGGTSTMVAKSTDNSGQINAAGTALTSVTLTFARPWPNAPNCSTSDNSLAFQSDPTSISTTQMVISFTAGLTSAQVWYQCSGNQ